MRNRDRGFTLIELAMVLFVVALVIGGLMAPLGTSIEAERRKAAQAGLETIADVLVQYTTSYEDGGLRPRAYLPCPSQVSDRSDPDWGRAGDCSQEGYVPWLDLGLDEIRPWGEENGDLFRYRVDRRWGWFQYQEQLITGQWVTYTNRIRAHMEDPWGYASHLVVMDAHGVNLTGADPRCSQGGVEVDCFGPHDTLVEPNYPVAIVYHLGTNGVADGQNASFEALPCSNATGYEAAPPPPNRDPTCWGKPLYQGGTMAPGFDDLVVWIGRQRLIYALAEAGILNSP